VFRTLATRTIAFLAQILVQATLSIEEYIFRFYDVFAPAQTSHRSSATIRASAAGATDAMTGPGRLFFRN
jgi:hypothetical protein